MLGPVERLSDRYARTLLDLLGMTADVRATPEHPALAWRRAGLMAITGRPDGPGLVPPVAIASAADGALAALKAIAPASVLPDSGALLLGERAQILGLTRQGAKSPNGSCRLLESRGGRFALNLPRQDDWDLLPALFEAPVDNWDDVEQAAAGASRDPLVDRGRMFGMAIAADGFVPAPASPFLIRQYALPSEPSARPLVVDLSSLWAGPLAGSLLKQAGARVIKVESIHRPDSAREGSEAFYDLLNHGKESLALDFRRADDLARLHAIVSRADIVIAAARPRALAGLGLDAEGAAARGATWLSITAHGRTGDAAGWIGFGDDAAVAGGLSALMRKAWGEPLFAGDAIADPLTGIFAALAGWCSWLSGGGRIVSLALSTVVAHAAGLHQTGAIREWQAIAEADKASPYPLRAAAGPAPDLGTHNDAVLAELS